MRILGIIIATLLATMWATPAQAAAPDRHHHERKAWDTLPVSPPVQESLKRPGCRPFIETATSHRDPSGLDKWVDMRTKINARQCKGQYTGKRWVDPVSVEFSYNVEGADQSCGFFDEFEGVHFDLYMKDGSGRNYHLPRVYLPCEQDTTNWDIRTLRLSPNFRWCFGVPRWKTLWTIRIDDWNDNSGSHEGYLWDFHGPVRNECK